MRRYRSLNMERLERRSVLTGDVGVAVVAGDLVVQGDAADNFLILWQDSGTGDWVVAGGTRNSIITPSETTINGQLAPQSFSGVTGKLLVDLDTGINNVVVTNAEILGDAEIKTGTSIDQVFFETGSISYSEITFQPNQGTTIPWGPLQFDGDVTIDTGGELDQIVINGHTELHGNLTLDAGAGNDWLRMRSSARLHVPGNMTVDLGDGNDQYDLIFLDVDGDLTITDSNSGNGLNVYDDTEIQVHNTNVGGAITVTADIGITQLEFQHVVAQSITASLGADNDRFQAIDVQVVSFALDTGEGDDAGNYWFFEQQRFENSIFLQDVQATLSLDLATWGGNDSVYFYHVTSPNIYVTTGTGSDGLLAFGVTTNSATFFTNEDADIIGLYQVEAALWLAVITGDGNEGGDHFGLVIGDSTIYGTLTIDTGNGLDNVLLGSVNAATVNIATGLGSDGLIMRFCNMINTTINTGDSPDVVGIYNANFQDLVVLLGIGVDSLYLGDTNVYHLTDLRGEGGRGSLRRLGANLLTGLTVSNLDSISG